MATAASRPKPLNPARHEDRPLHWLSGKQGGAGFTL
jgi:hypothetical protein